MTTREDVGDLFELLISYQKKHRPFPEKAEIHHHLFPGKDYQALRVRATMSDLQEMIETYLLLSFVRANPVRAKLILSKIYRQRALPKHFLHTTSEAGEYLEEQAYRNPDYYRDLLDYETEMLQFQSATRRTGGLNLQEISNHIDVLFLIRKLRHTCTLLTHEQVFKTHYDQGLLTPILEEIEKKGFLKIPAVSIYYHCYRFLTEQYNLLHFQRFREILTRYAHQFTEVEVRDLYLLAINFCIRKLNEGQEEYGRQGLVLYKQGLQESFLLENGWLSRFTFNNIVGSSLRLREFDWAEQFIVDYEAQLEASHRESTVQFNRARLEYARGNYRNAMLLLSTTEFNDMINNLIAKTILLKIYYELKEYDLLDSHLDNFQSYIRRHQTSDFHQTNYQNIIRLVRKLLALKPGDKHGKAVLGKAIKETPILSEKQWLLGQLV
ncbi:MAG: hypothetical protein DHS20C18_04690 [Saprospiraceae bacterium]|nr:MAG: hypothetical protein DHS20C18_04690 [Saprospiraceae bacterium]